MNRSIINSIISFLLIGFLFSENLDSNQSNANTSLEKSQDNTELVVSTQKSSSTGHQMGEHFFRWIHIIAGVLWIGLLYFFNWVNGPFVATLDAGTKKKVVPELMPRALYWFRWGAAWTWFSGMCLMVMIYWFGIMSNIEGEGFEEWSGHWAYLLPFVMVFVYDALYNSPIGKNTRLATIISYLGIAGVLYLMICVADFKEFRFYNMHIGAMFGSIMAFNVWFRIWPAQQKIITAIKDGDAPDGDLVALAGLRSKHNTYMSVPLIWTMINSHTATTISSLGLPDGVFLMIIIAVGWHIVFQLYKKSAKITGF
tara:strand:- start:2 stop:937 length:936 start_codon:yes stop_codon:yes gene_type:complete